MSAPAPATASSPRVTRILVVDDNRDAADSLAEFLGHIGLEVHVAYDGPSAVETADRWRPDVVLLDIGLPGMNGYEVARTMRARPELAGLRLIAVTGYGQQKDVEASREAGIDQHLVKPIDLKVLERLIA